MKGGLLPNGYEPHTAFASIKIRLPLFPGLSFIPVFSSHMQAVNNALQAMGWRSAPFLPILFPYGKNGASPMFLQIFYPLKMQRGLEKREKQQTD
jgi:hypothetical protein